MDKELEVNNYKLSTKKKENLGKRVVRMMKRYNEPKKAAEICKCKRQPRLPWKKYKHSGVSALKAMKTGRKTNTSVLNIEQQKWIQKLLTDKNPEQLKLLG